MFQILEIHLFGKKKHEKIESSRQQVGIVRRTGLKVHNLIPET